MDGKRFSTKKLFITLLLCLIPSLMFAATLKDTLRYFLKDSSFLQLSIKGKVPGSSSTSIDMTILIPREQITSISTSKITEGESAISFMIIATANPVDPMFAEILDMNHNEKAFIIPMEGTTISTDSNTNLYLSFDINKARDIMKAF